MLMVEKAVLISGAKGMESGKSFSMRILMVSPRFTFRVGPV